MQLNKILFQKIILTKINSRTEIKITYFNRTDCISIYAENVLRLQVPVSDAFLVEKVQARSDLLHDLGCVVFREADVLLDARQQRATVNLLEDQVELLFVLEELNQLQDVWMALAMMEGLDFAKDPCPSMARYLINNLYGTLNIGVNIYTCSVMKRDSIRLVLWFVQRLIRKLTVLRHRHLHPKSRPSTYTVLQLKEEENCVKIEPHE